MDDAQLRAMYEQINKYTGTSRLNHFYNNGFKAGFKAACEWKNIETLKSLKQHEDDEAVDRFAHAIKEKLALAREKGRSGWQQMGPNELSAMLREHVEKGDPRDVANFCMFLWHQGARIDK